jgi:hypothetical protein
MCQWGFNIVDACGVERNLAVVAITYFDRFLSCRGVRVVEVCLASQREFQLAFIVSSMSRWFSFTRTERKLRSTHLHYHQFFVLKTCLVISLKGREGMKISPDFVAKTLCEQMYHPDEVIEMEGSLTNTSMEIERSDSTGLHPMLYRAASLFK